eukprot:scaffold3461_cov116-Isochrysis_galbana.AAC.8
MRARSPPPAPSVRVASGRCVPTAGRGGMSEDARRRSGDPATPPPRSSSSVSSLSSCWLATAKDSCEARRAGPPWVCDMIVSCESSGAAGGAVAPCRRRTHP